MSDTEKQYRTDEAGKRILPPTDTPQKYKMAVEELGLCMNCVDHAVRCSLEIDTTLTDNQVSNSVEQMTAAITTINDVANNLHGISESLKADTTKFMQRVKNSLTVASFLKGTGFTSLGGFIVYLISL